MNSPFLNMDMDPGSFSALKVRLLVYHRVQITYLEGLLY